MALAEFLAPIQVISYDDRASEKYGDIRANLERIGKIIGPLDMLIASHALSLDCILVTNNTQEFERIKSLRIENWV
jgi:tRNA(fMet)-specific endonuclease VapC